MREGPASHDDELIRGTLSGDSRAFEEIVRSYQGYLFAAVLPIVGDAFAAQDVVQEAFLKAYRSMGTYRGPNLKAWLGRVAVNAAIDWNRRKARQPQVVSSILPASQGRSPEEEFLERAGHSELAKAVRRLPAPYQRVFMQRYAEGFDHRTIADSEGISLRTVESRLYRARRMLREVLTEG